MGQYGKPEEPTIYVTPQIPMKNRRPRITLGITKIEHYNIEPGKIYKITLEDPETKKKYTYYFKTPKEIINKIYIGTPTLKPHKHYRIVEIFPYSPRNFIEILNDISQREKIGIRLLIIDEDLYIVYKKKYIKANEWKYGYKKGGIPYLELEIEKEKPVRLLLENGKLVIRQYSHTKRQRSGRSGVIVYQKIEFKQFKNILNRFSKRTAISIRYSSEDLITRKTHITVEKLELEITPPPEKMEEIIMSHKINYIKIAEKREGNVKVERYKFYLQDVNSNFTDKIRRFYWGNYFNKNFTALEKLSFAVVKDMLNKMGLPNTREHPLSRKGSKGPDIYASNDKKILLEVKFRTVRGIGKIRKEAWDIIRRHVYEKYKEKIDSLKVTHIGIIIIRWKIHKGFSFGEIHIEITPFEGGSYNA